MMSNSQQIFAITQSNFGVIQVKTIKIRKLMVFFALTLIFFALTTKNFALNHFVGEQ